MSQIIKVLGTGCPKCQTLTNLTKEVVEENNIQATIEKVEDIMKIMEYNVMSTPALVINEKVVIKGRVPSKEEILSALTTEMKEDKTGDGTSNCCCGSGDCC